MRTPFAFADSYKLSHWIQYPEDVRYVYSNFTPRWTLCQGIDRFVFFGLQAFLDKLVAKFERDFFDLDLPTALADFSLFYERFFLEKPADQQMGCVKALWQCGYLPLRIKALPEGSVVRHGIPVLTVENTVPGLHWMTNFIESWMSSEIWHPSTSATTSLYYRVQFDRFAKETSDQDFMPEFQGHDFCFRGMEGIEAAAASGAGHCLSSKGSDNLPVISWVDRHYGVAPDLSLIHI